MRNRGRHTSLVVWGSARSAAMRLRIVGVAYAIGVITTFGAANADLDWSCHHRWQDVCDASMVRGNQGMAAFVAIFPPGWIVIPFATGFYQHGIYFGATPAIGD
jgi:hypothetical protein